MSDPHVVGVGAYVPRGRLGAATVRDAVGSFDAAGVDSTAVPAADEDALTMAVAAAERALDAAGVGADSLAGLTFGTTTPPLAEADPTARLGSALGVPGSAVRRCPGHSTRAGTRALAVALDAGTVPALAVAADCPRGEPDDSVEHAAGAGAAAFVVDDVSTEGLAVVDRAERTTPYPGTRFRSPGERTTRGIEVREYDREAFVAPCVAAVEALGVEPESVDAVVVQSPDGDRPGRVVDALSVPTDRLVSTVETLGDCGAASVPLTLARALGEGHERVLAVGHASGASADAMVVDGSVPVEWDAGDPTHLDYSDYQRRRGELSGRSADTGGAYVSVPRWRDSLPQRHRLVAGACPACGALAFPPEGACRECHDLVDYDRVALPATGTVETVTTVADDAAPPEFAELQARSGAVQVAVVAFDARSESVSVPLQVAADADPVAPGETVETTFRWLYTQEGVPRYARKVVPTGE